jgi:putative ABC transport system permease protein
MAFGISVVARLFSFDWTYAVPMSGIVLGLGVSTAIGLIFGVFPARKASRMNPIEALRHE